MANISSATGTLHFSKELVQQPELLKRLILCIQKENELERTYYATIFIDDLPSILQQLDTLDESSTTFSLDFEGTGRWTYSRNVANFFNWLQNAPDLQNSDWLKKLFDAPHSYLEFRFIDFEPGCEIFYAANIQIQPVCRDGALTTLVMKEWYDDIPFTAQHLQNHEIASQAYDSENLAELLQVDSFMNDLSHRIPLPVITETFLAQAWETERLSVIYDSDLEDYLLEILEDYYLNYYLTNEYSENA
ncbi:MULTISPECIES: hypothetical protein [Listeria]|uniref:hypothetical protein n=1 Tax=Listeria TaxID=1637 RepID=UPI000B596FDE|nr:MULTISPECIES: hypothetical protein [Listeria]